MGTRATLGRMNGDILEGNYNHWDGYPTGLGATLAKRAAEAPDLEAFVTYITTDHPRGWSSLGDTLEGDECYCHDRDEGMTEWQAFAREDWAYGIDVDTRTMHIFRKGDTPIATFSLDDLPDFGKIESDAYADD